MPKLSGLCYKPIGVKSRVDGHSTKARLCTCPCGNPEWLIYLIDGHQHLQCLRCGETFCDGSCSADPR